MKNKNQTIACIVLLAVLAAALIGVMVYGIVGGYGRGLFQRGAWETPGRGVRDNAEAITEADDPTLTDVAYDAAFSRVRIEANACDITLKTSADNRTRVIVACEKDYVNVSADEAELSVKIKIPSSIGLRGVKAAAAEIYLPETYANAIIVKNDAGDFSAEAFPLANFEIRQDAGDVEIARAKAADVRVDAGDVEIGEAEDAVVQCDAGNIDIDAVNGHMDLQNDCGEIRVGRVNLTENAAVVNHLGNVTIGETNKIYIDAHTDLGSESIRNNDPQANVTLRISNDCGNITVNNG